MRITSDSSAIVWIAYNPRRRVLHVQFRRGGAYQRGCIYRYGEVPKGIAREFFASESVGTYFNRNIRGRYVWERFGSFGPTL